MKNNILEIQKKILSACEKSGRDIKDIFLLPVSKTFDVSAIQEAMDLGFEVFGENKVQEILSKYEYFNGNVKFHMIGALQTNKVKYIIDKVDLIHSLDRISLLEKLNSEAKKRDMVVNCLIEVNIGKEENKAGIFEEDLMDFMELVSKKTNVLVKGLMAIVPFEEDAEDTRKYFKKMKELFDKIAEKDYDNIKMEILSMGMSGDFDIAIEEGSTLIRVGSAIFGNRNYNWLLINLI